VIVNKHTIEDKLYHFILFAVDLLSFLHWFTITFRFDSQKCVVIPCSRENHVRQISNVLGTDGEPATSKSKTLI
jgi:hypothetical protein